MRGGGAFSPDAHNSDKQQLGRRWGSPVTLTSLCVNAILISLCTWLSWPSPQAYFPCDQQPQRPLARPGPAALEPWNVTQGPELYDIFEETRRFTARSDPHQSSFMIAPRDRLDIPRLMGAMGFETGVELGVQIGDYSWWSLKVWPNCKKYYLWVDIWAEQANYHDLAAVGNAEQNKAYEYAKELMKEYGDRAVIVRNLTVDAVHVVPGLVDYVYVDARHDYCATKEDIETWWPKLRPGGVMAGHDYFAAAEVWPGQDWSLCTDGSRNKGAVMGAVNEFAFLHGLHVMITWKVPGGPDPCWLIRKPFHHHTSKHHAPDSV